MTSDFKRKEERRLQLLKRYYEAHEENPDAFTDTRALARTAGLGDDLAELHRTLDYLTHEDLIQATARGPEGLIYRITHKGILHIERLTSQPQPDTLPAHIAVTQHFHGSIGAVQTGQTNAATINMSERPQLMDLLTLVAQLRALHEYLPSDVRPQYLAEVDDLEQELQATPGKPNRLRRINDTLAAVATFGGHVAAIKKVIDDLGDLVRGAL